MRSRYESAPSRRKRVSNRATPKAPSCSEHRQTHVAGDVGVPPQTPAGGLSPCTPFLGLRPKRTLSLAGYLCFSSEFPFGATPQNPARGAWLRTRNEYAAKGRPQRVCAAALRLIEKPVKYRRPPPFIRSFASSKKMPRAKRLAWGLGRSPKWERKAKVEWR